MTNTRQCCQREHFAYSLYSKFREPKLFRLATKGDFQSIPARCRAHPKEATFVHKFVPNDTALHCVFRWSPDEEVDDNDRAAIETSRIAAVSALLEANPKAAVKPNAFLRVPLHLACMYYCPKSSSCVKAVAALVKCAPEAVCMGDFDKRTPLHLLIARHERIPADVVALLLEHGGPSVVGMRDAAGETPLDILHRLEGTVQNASEIKKMLEAQNMETPAESPVEEGN